MAKIIKEIDGVQEAEGAWTFRLAEDGKKTLVGRFSGAPETIAKMALSLSVGGGGSIPAGWAPTDGNAWVLVSAEASHESPVEAILTLTYAYVPADGGSGSGGGGTVDENREETADFQNIEKPLTAAPFWKSDSEGSDLSDPVTATQAMKIAQLYIDADDISAAESELNKNIEAQRLVPATSAIRAFIAKRLAGVEAFFYPAPTLSVSTQSAEPPSDFGADVAKIVTAPDFKKIPVPEGFDWLGAGDRLTFSGGVYTRERSYIGADKWDEDLYQRV